MVDAAIAEHLEILRLAAVGKLKGLWTSYLALGGSAFAILAGAGAMTEMVYHRQLNAAVGPHMRFMGVALDSSALDSWGGAGWVLLTGVGLFEFVRRRFVREWGQAHEEIEAEMKLGEAP